VSRSDNFARFAETESVSSSLRRKSVLAAVTTGAGSSLDFGIRLATTLILARLLVPEDFGLIAMVTVVTRVAQFTFIGLSTPTIQVPEITYRQSSNLFWINVAAGVFLAGSLALLAPALAGFYDELRLVPIARVLALNFILGGLSQQHLALLTRQMKLPQIAGNTLVASLLSSCFAIVLALTGFGYWALVLRDLVGGFLTALGAWALCPWVPGLPDRREKMHRLLTFGRDMTLKNLLQITSAQLDALLIGRFAGPAALGLYRQAYNLVVLLTERWSGPIRNVSKPGLSALQFQPSRYRRYYGRILSVISLPTIPFGFFVAIYAHEIILVVLGQKWLGAVVFVRIFGGVAAISPALSTSSLILLTRGMSGKLLAVTLVSSASLVILMLVGASWGAVGIAAAHLATPVLLAPWLLYFTMRKTPVSVGDFLLTISKPLVASLAMASAVALFRAVVHLESALLSLALGSVTATTAYFSAYSLLPGGWAQLHWLASELTALLSRRSSTKVKPRRNKT